MRPMIVFVLSVVACVGAQAQSPSAPSVTRIQSPACASAPEASGDAAAMSGCYRVWAPNFAELKTDAERLAAMREWQRVNALWHTAQVLGRGHYAVRQATKEEPDALSKIGPPGEPWSDTPAASTSRSAARTHSGLSALRAGDATPPAAAARRRERRTVTNGSGITRTRSERQNGHARLVSHLRVELHDEHGSRRRNRHHGHLPGPRDSLRSPCGYRVSAR